MGIICIQFIDDGLDSGLVLAGTTVTICTKIGLVQYNTLPGASEHWYQWYNGVLLMYNSASNSYKESPWYHDILPLNHNFDICYYFVSKTFTKSVLKNVSMIINSNCVLNANPVACSDKLCKIFDGIRKWGQLISELTAVLFLIHLIQIWQIQSQENFKLGKKWQRSLRLYEEEILIGMPLE